MARAFHLLAAIAAMSIAWPLSAQMPVATEKFALREGFVFSTDKPRILLFQPEVKVGEQTTAGIFQNNADWHAAAKRELTAALVRAGNKRGFEMVLHQEKGGSGQTLIEHRALFRLVVNMIIRHKLFGKDQLPSKTAAFDWSLGSGLSGLASDAQADYGLFLLNQGSFESSGRRAAKLVASLMGNEDTAGTHFAYAALFDLRNGDIVWLGVDLRAAGDVRTAEGASHRIGQLLNGFPSPVSGQVVAQ